MEQFRDLALHIVSVQDLDYEPAQAAS